MRSQFYRGRDGEMKLWLERPIFAWDTTKTLWGIRHVRWMILRYRVTRWAEAWGRVGIGLGVPNESDLRYLDRVWRGEGG